MFARGTGLFFAGGAMYYGLIQRVLSTRMIFIVMGMTLNHSVFEWT